MSISGGKDMKKNLPKQKLEQVRLVLSVLVFIILIPITILAIPKTLALAEPQNRVQLQQQFESLGIKGWVFFLGIQILQVVVAMIPGEPIEIFAGLMYGPVIGTLSCMLGIFIGSILVYFLVKKIGMPIVSIFIEPEKFQNLRFLKDKERFERIAFLLFFIPGTPKDLLTWAAGLIDIRPIRFFIISTIARLPSILTSTLAGASLISGNFATTLIIFVVTGCVSLMGILIHRKLAEK